MIKITRWLKSIIPVLLLTQAVCSFLLLNSLIAAGLFVALLWALGNGEIATCFAALQHLATHYLTATHAAQRAFNHRFALLFIGLMLVTSLLRHGQLLRAIRALDPPRPDRSQDDPSQVDPSHCDRTPLSKDSL